MARELAPGEWSVLALLAEAPAHGWALAKDLARTGNVGRVWTVRRPLVYRALDVLESRGLIEEVGSERGVRGPNRAIFASTPLGSEQVRDWLCQPVEHVHEMRSLFLLKLVLLERAGMDRTPLLEAQRTQSAAAAAALEARVRASIGVEHVLVRFRLENTRAVVAFIDSLLAGESGAPRQRRHAGT
jgi:PadR family transcriptional regulator AphA